MSDMSEADKIRSKRLAKLQGQASGSSSQAQTQRADADVHRRDASAASAAAVAGQSTSEAQQTGPETPAASDAAAPPSATVDEHGQPDARASDGEVRIRIRPASSTSEALKRKDGASSADRPLRDGSPFKRPGSAASMPEYALDAWEDKTLSSIFRVTLDASVDHDGHGNSLRHLPGLQAELEEQGSAPRLSVSVLEQAILEAASTLDGKAPLDYLLGCWKRVTRLLRNVRNASREDAKYRILQEAKRLCMSYCIFAATIPEMFGIEPSSINPLVTHLLVDPADDRGICHDFLTEAVRRLPADESIRDVMLDALEEISRQLAGMTMIDNFKPHVLALRNVANYPPLVDALTQRPFFLPDDVAAEDIETSTFLGPYFQISPMQGPVTTNYFTGPRTKPKAHIINSQKALRLTLQTHQAELLDIVNHIIRASKQSRDRMLDWFARIVNANHKRRALQVDPAKVSTDGFMVNVTVCLDQLCERFMDATFSKIDRIDVDYLRRSPRVDVREETKLNADQEASDRFYARKVDGSSNFISEVFFLTLAAHHYGTEAVVTTLEQLEKDLKQLEKQLQRLEAERSKWINTPQLAMFENTVKKYHEAIDKALSYKYATEGVLYDDLSQARSMQFMRYVIVWLLRLVSSHHNYPAQQITLPLAREEPEAFKYLPEYYLENVVNSFKFIFRAMPHVVTSTQVDELVALCITFLRSSEYIKNPYLKSGLVSILFYGIWPTYSRQKGVLGDVLNSMPFATENLLHALLKFYIEVETTGAHTQFYDKFNIRYEIFQVIKCIWSNTIYRERLSQEAKKNRDFFVRFVNLLLNDVTFVLDESLTAFGKIHRLQSELQDGALEASARTEKEEQLAAAQSMAKNYMQLTNETVAMLKLFTAALADSFTMPEIVQRLADMLDYNVAVMVGPKRFELSVRNPEQYGFRPRVLLADLVDVFLNLSGKQAFVEAVARDGRSYKPANFDAAGAFLAKYNLKSPEELAAWARLAERVQQAKEAEEQAEEDLGDIPDEFLDPLMYTLMEDPVILPASRVSIDRSTIRSHLLSDAHDPFNRVPLSIEDVKPDVELKARIEAFRAERKASRKKAMSASNEEQPQQLQQQGKAEGEGQDEGLGQSILGDDGGEPMDTSPG